jgi:hypothetical protein
MLVWPRIVAGVAVGLLLAGCGDEGRGSGQPTAVGATSASARAGAVGPPAGEAALLITTQVGEQCPHLPLTPDPRCDPRRRPDTAFEVRLATGDMVHEGRSGADGRATVVVRPGAYVVRGERVAGYQFTPERRVTANADATVAVPLTYTTGIQ